MNSQSLNLSRESIYFHCSLLETERDLTIEKEMLRKKSEEGKWNQMSLCFPSFSFSSSPENLFFRLSMNPSVSYDDPSISFLFPLISFVLLSSHTLFYSLAINSNWSPLFLHRTGMSLPLLLPSNKLWQSLSNCLKWVDLSCFQIYVFSLTLFLMSSFVSKRSVSCFCPVVSHFIISVSCVLSRFFSSSLTLEHEWTWISITKDYRVYWRLNKSFWGVFVCKTLTVDQ